MYLPKFKIEGSSFNLKKILQEHIGLNHPFSDKADFTFMDPNRTIKIDSVIHKAMIEVNEQGAEAAAATAVIMAMRMMLNEDIKVVNCNKPFIFTITH